MCDNQGMAGGSIGFWGVVKASLIGFLICLLIIIFIALWADSMKSRSLSDKQVATNLAPVGKILYRNN